MTTLNPFFGIVIDDIFTQIKCNSEVICHLWTNDAILTTKNITYSNDTIRDITVKFDKGQNEVIDGLEVGQSGTFVFSENGIIHKIECQVNFKQINGEEITLELMPNKSAIDTISFDTDKIPVSDSSTIDMSNNPNSGIFSQLKISAEEGNAIKINPDGVYVGTTEGVKDYPELTNKPSINNVTLEGNKTSMELNLVSRNEFNALDKEKANVRLDNVNVGSGKTGDVVNFNADGSINYLSLFPLGEHTAKTAETTLSIKENSIHLNTDVIISPKEGNKLEIDTEARGLYVGGSDDSQAVKISDNQTNILVGAETNEPLEIIKVEGKDETTIHTTNTLNFLQTPQVNGSNVVSFKEMCESFDYKQNGFFENYTQAALIDVVYQNSCSSNIVLNCIFSNKIHKLNVFGNGRTMTLVGNNSETIPDSGNLTGLVTNNLNSSNGWLRAYHEAYNGELGTGRYGGTNAYNGDGLNLPRKNQKFNNTLIYSNIEIDRQEQFSIQYSDTPNFSKYTAKELFPDVNGNFEVEIPKGKYFKFVTEKTWGRVFINFVTFEFNSMGSIKVTTPTLEFDINGDFNQFMVGYEINQTTGLLSTMLFKSKRDFNSYYIVNVDDITEIDLTYCNNPFVGNPIFETTQFQNLTKIILPKDRYLNSYNRINMFENPQIIAPKQFEEQYRANQYWNAIIDKFIFE